MTKLSLNERLELIHYHASALAKFGNNAWPDTKGAVFDHLTRLTALLKTIPKDQFGVER